MPIRPPFFGATKRRNAQDRGYDAAWQQAARDYRKAHPYCLGCQAVGRMIPATVVDHIVPHLGNKQLFWDRANWQPACGFHHDTVKRRIENRYIRGDATKADLRLDSVLAQALTRYLMR